MERSFKILLLTAALLIAAAGCYPACPQVPPTNKISYKDTRCYKKAVAAIEQNARLSSHGPTVGRFRAGWAWRPITPPTWRYPLQF